MTSPSPQSSPTTRHSGRQRSSVSDQIDTAPTGGLRLELSIVTEAAARQPSAPWRFLPHVTTSPTDGKVVVEVGRDGDPDLPTHYTVVSATGIVVQGESPAASIGPVGRGDVLRYLADELTWAETNAGGSYGVLNAARAR